MAKSNSNRLNVSKQLQKIAKNLEINLTNVIEDKLLETYKTNVLHSYTPRSKDGGYESTGTFVDSVYTQVEDNTISIMIADIPYENSNNKSTVDVHTFLTEGTKGGGEYAYLSEDNGLEFARNYPTPPHHFEEHTVVQMEGFLDGLMNDIEKGKYNK